MSGRWIGLVVCWCLGLQSVQAGEVVPHDQRPLRIVYANQWAPLSYGDDTQVRGILPALVEEIIGKRMGRVVVHRGVPWGRAQSMVRSGAVDGFITTPTPARLRYSQRSEESLYELVFKAYSRKESEAGKALEAGTPLQSLSHFQFCDVLGNGWADRFYGELEIAFETTAVADNCLKMLSMGRTDLFIHSQAVTDDKIQGLNLAWIVQRHERIFDRVGFVLMLSNQTNVDHSLIQRFDQELASMRADGSYQALLERVKVQAH
ncbi:substrate-binding periplasmic protein [Aestuariirhabdus litorea]|nr:transporter substrate-binding domain-containing protein [Aestuariirhabdus litorea]